MATLKKHLQIHNKSKAFAVLLQTTKAPIHICKKEMRNYKMESHACQKVSNVNFQATIALKNCPKMHNRSKGFCKLLTTTDTPAIA